MNNADKSAVCSELFRVAEDCKAESATDVVVRVIGRGVERVIAMPTTGETFASETSGDASEVRSVVTDLRGRLAAADVEIATAKKRYAELGKMYKDSADHLHNILCRIRQGLGFSSDSDPTFEKLYAHADRAGEVLGRADELLDELRTDAAETLAAKLKDLTK